MIRPEQIPDEVVIMAGEGFLEADRVPSCSFDDAIRAAIAAALNAWPGATHITEGEPGREHSELILPLSQEARDGE